MNPIEPNTPDRIHRVRRRNTTWRVTRTDGTKVTVPVVNSGGYTSRVSVAVDAAGTVTMRPVQP